MALTPEQIAAAVVRDCRRRKRMSNGEIRLERSPLIGQWLRKRTWFLKEYPEYEAQAELYWKISRELFRLTEPKKIQKKKLDPRPHEDLRNLRLFP